MDDQAVYALISTAYSYLSTQTLFGDSDCRSAIVSRVSYLSANAGNGSGFSLLGGLQQRDRWPNPLVSESRRV